LNKGIHPAAISDGF